MNDGFVRELRESIINPQVVTDLEGRPRIFIPKGWEDATPPIPAPKALELVTLTGLRDYIEDNVDGLTLDGLMLHVESHSVVSLVGKLRDEKSEYRRHRYIAAKAPEATFLFGRYYDSESFVIALQTCFVRTPERDALVTLVSSIKESGVRETVDDGVAQEVTTKRGVALSDRTRVPNPVKLRPYRTFREIDQPESELVLRLMEGKGEEKPTCALFEADGGAWKLQAIQDVAAWLEAQIKTVATVA